MLAPRSFLFGPMKQSVGPPSKPPSRSDALPPTTSSEGTGPISSACDTVKAQPPSAVLANVEVGLSEPVVIPRRPSRDGNQRYHRVVDRRHNSRDQYSQGKHSSSVTSLLANTTIPPPRSRKTARLRNSEIQRLTVDASFSETDDSEKEYARTLGENPLDFLLCPPDDVVNVDPIGTDASLQQLSYISKATMSMDSVFSLTDYSIKDASLSLGSSLSPQSRGKRLLPTRKLEPLTLSLGDPPPGHPLSDPDLERWVLDFRVFEDKDEHNQKQHNMSALPQKSAFKSNLTASLRALRSAAKSISNMTAPMITPDDFLTRSIITIDPKVPFTDERMPPLLDNMPTPALRRYFNPTTNAPIEAHVHTPHPRPIGTQCTTSIQMETYKISRISKTEMKNDISKGANTCPADIFSEVTVGPVARQRDMRENSDFIRVAVMEMRMRKNGKLAENMPGRARWALPPRRVSTSVYEIGKGGVPLRWIGVTAG